MSWAELKNAFLKGIGKRPTRYVFRYSPTWKNPFQFDLLEIMRCDADGDVITYKKASHPLGIHAGHRVKSPGKFSFFELLLVQLRAIE